MVLEIGLIAHIPFQREREAVALFCNVGAVKKRIGLRKGAEQFGHAPARHRPSWCRMMSVCPGRRLQWWRLRVRVAVDVQTLIRTGLIRDVRCGFAKPAEEMLHHLLSLAHE